MLHHKDGLKKHNQFCSFAMTFQNSFPFQNFFYFFKFLSPIFFKDCPDLASSICELRASKSGLGSLAWDLGASEFVLGLLNGCEERGLALFSSWPMRSCNVGPRRVCKTSLGRSSMYLGMPVPQRKLASSSEKLLQLWLKML